MEPIGSSTMRFLRHGRANEWSRIWRPNPRRISSVIGVGDVPPRRSMLRRGVHEKTAERPGVRVIHLPCHALKTHVGSTTGSKFHPRMLHRSQKKGDGETRREANVLPISPSACFPASAHLGISLRASSIRWSLASMNTRKWSRALRCTCLWNSSYQSGADHFS